MPKEDWEQNNLAKIHNLPKVNSVLDVGCGLSFKAKYIDADIRVGVDIYEPYLKAIESEVPYVVVRHDIRDLDSIFIPKSFDLVIACDVIEHLDKTESLKLIASCERIAKRAVILETPKGFIPQDIDILGFGAHDLQTHKCGWEPSELQNLGYTVTVRDYQMSDTKRHSSLEVETNIQLLEAIKWLES